MTGVMLCACLLINRMECDLGGREREDQPALAGIDGTKSQDLPTECAIRLGILAVEKDVSAGNHEEEFSKIFAAECPSW